MNSSHSDKTIVTLPSNEHAAFEKWLLAEQGLDAQWDASRNCYMPFPAHVACIPIWTSRLRDEGFSGGHRR